METLRFDVHPKCSVSALLLQPPEPMACLVLAHGAGAGMHHPFMETIARALFDRRIATLRYQFPYMELGATRPDRPAVAHATVRAAVHAARQQCANSPLFVGGRSFGGRMTSQAQSVSPLPDVRGVVFFGFPLHPAGKPSTERAAHLSAITLPMLFLQGSQDKLADPLLITKVVEKIGGKIHLINQADHSFHVPKRSGRTDDEVINEIGNAVEDWVNITLARQTNFFENRYFN